MVHPRETHTREKREAERGGRGFRRTASWGGGGGESEARVLKPLFVGGGEGEISQTGFVRMRRASSRGPCFPDRGFVYTERLRTEEEEGGGGGSRRAAARTRLRRAN